MYHKILIKSIVKYKSFSIASMEASRCVPTQLELTAAKVTVVDLWLPQRMAGTKLRIIYIGIEH